MKTAPESFPSGTFGVEQRLGAYFFAGDWSKHDPCATSAAIKVRARRNRTLADLLSVQWARDFAIELCSERTWAAILA